MKRIRMIVCILSFFICLSACGEQNHSASYGSNNSANISETSHAQPLEITEKFFDAFEQGDYALMKTYCTKECIDSYFQEGSVSGMIWCRAVKLEEQESSIENESIIAVDVEMETAKTSVLYGESETSFYVVLNKTDDGSWAINKFPTGL